MANDQLVLQINKINISPDKSYVKYNQNERGKVIDINVIDNDGINAYDLTNKKIRFVDDKEDNKLVLDDEADNPGHFTRTADAQGKFSYTFHDLVYQRSGIARFEIYTDSEHIDATANFEIQIENTGSLVAANESYISSLEGLVAHYHRMVDTTVSETQQLINSLTDKINQAISNGQRDVANELSDARTKLQAIQDQENKLIASWTTELNTQKQNFTALQSQWQAQSKTISDSYQAKINEINTQAQSQHDTIQAAADQQLKDNQSASDAEIAKVESETKAKLDEVEKAKNDAIADLTAQRDAQLKAAKDAYDKQRTDQQVDYETWKTNTLTDFNALVKPLKSELTTDRQDLKDISDQIAATKKEMANLSSQLDSIDLTKFVTGNQFKEAMAKKASGLKVRGLRGDYVMAVDTTTSNIDGTPAGNSGSGLVDSTVLAGVMQTISDAILGKNHYTKDEVDNLLKNVKDQLTPLIEQKADTTTLTDRANALAKQISDLQTENNNLKNVNTQLQQQNNNLQKQVTKLTPVHVSSVDDVANQDAYFVIVDD